MTRFGSLMITGALGALLLGCTQTPPARQTGDPVVDGALSTAYRQIGSLPTYSAGPEEPIPAPQLGGESVTVVWQGDADSLLRKVAHARGMDFKVYGPFPRQSLPVFVNMSGVPYGEFMKDVGHQFGQRADLILTNNLIEIRYRGPAPQ